MTTPTPEQLRPHYSDFLGEYDPESPPAADKPARILLTGHSHQAWPNVAQEGVMEAYRDAAKKVDLKWSAASEVADELRAAIASRIGAQADEIALGQNTHELLTRFLSALPLKSRPHLVTTAGEFHSMDRQLRRLSEEGVEVSFVDPAPLDTLSARLAEALRPETAALMVSTVLFETSSVVPELKIAVKRAQELGAEVLLDAYHAFSVLPFSLGDFGVDPIFVTGGGYKYAQWGEGCCFLRVPPQTALRPIYTGWFSDFASLSGVRDGGPTTYGSRPADRFAGSTYDPTSHYRARAVLGFFDEMGLTPEVLREISLRQTRRLREGLQGYTILTPEADEAHAGFVSVKVEETDRVVEALLERGVWVDARGQALRFGPAPYLLDAELDAAVAIFRDIMPLDR